jgi:hypothetical protein
VAARRDRRKLLVRDAGHYAAAMLRPSISVCTAFAAFALTACGDGKQPAAASRPTLTYFTMTG